MGENGNPAALGHEGVRRTRGEGPELALRPIRGYDLDLSRICALRTHPKMW